MGDKPENPPAFPLLDVHAGMHKTGMTLRDYFAAVALQGILADPQKTKEAERMSRAQDDNAFIVKLNSGLAYAYADAMLSERTKTDGK